MAFQGHFTRAPGYQYHRKNNGKFGFQIFPYKPIHLSHDPMIIPYLSHPKFILYLFNLFHYHALTHTHTYIYIYIPRCISIFLPLLTMSQGSFHDHPIFIDDLPIPNGYVSIDYPMVIPYICPVRDGLVTSG